MHFDRFDICEAYWLFAADYHVGGWATGRRRPTHTTGRANGDIWTRLSRIGFRLSPLRDYAEDLTDNGLAIYDALAERDAKR